MSRASESPADLNGQEYTLLIVDDDPANLGALTEYLEDEYGFTVLISQDGESGLQRARYAQPDLILLDVRMPGMDGFETCRRLKADETTRDIPVIFMTALTSTEDKVKGFAVGAVDYVTKPFQQEEVFVRITTHLRLRELTRSLQHSNRELSQTLAHLKATQQQLIESEKVSALGGLIAGVAYEINSPVGVGITMVSKLKDDTESVVTAYQSGQVKLSELEAYFASALHSYQIILTSLQRVVSLVKSFQHVAIDQTSLEKRIFPVKSSIEETLLSLSPKLRRKKHTFTVNGDETITIESYPGALSQVVTNLVMNSMSHAYQKGEQGHLRFDLRQAQDRVIIEYADDGCGITPEHLSKIFDPFFTTARNQGMSGLGLHIVYLLVTQKMKGTIRCESQVGAGTKFILDLPIQISEEPEG